MGGELGALFNEVKAVKQQTHAMKHHKEAAPVHHEPVHQKTVKPHKTVQLSKVQLEEQKLRDQIKKLLAEKLADQKHDAE